MGEAAFHHPLRHVVTAKDSGLHKKLFNIQFGPDGSIYVDYGYYKPSEGIISLCTLDAGGTYPRDVSLEKYARVASSTVKYSHHPSGDVGFSKSGKVRREIKKQCPPLTGYEGHLFTIQLQGLKAFQDANEKRDAGIINKRRQVWTIELPEGIKENALKIMGWWEKMENMKGLKPSLQDVAMKGFFKLKDRILPAFYLAPPMDCAIRSHILIITVEKTDKLNQEESCLSMIGGFDGIEKAFNANKETTFLAMSYPVKNKEDLIQRIGSADIKE